MKGLFKFIGVVIALAIIIALALAILDMTSYAHNPDNATAYAFITSVRNLFPENWIQTWDGWRATFLNWLTDVLDLAKTAS